MTSFDLDRVISLLLPGEIEWSLHFEEVCDSTQDLARAAVSQDAGEGWTMITDLQRLGRGRQGRTWVTPPGAALLFSTVLRPAIDVVPLLPLLAGLAVAGGIEACCGVVADLKWPNDVLLGARKLAGILLERPAGSAVILGAGINVNQVGDELPEGAVSIAQAVGHPADREALLASILNDLSNAYERADREGVEWIVPAWRSRSSMLGESISFQHDGTTMIGVAEDIGQDGALLVRTGNGSRITLMAGEVERVRRL